MSAQTCRMWSEKSNAAGDKEGDDEIDCRRRPGGGPRHLPSLGVDNDVSKLAVCHWLCQCYVRGDVDWHSALAEPVAPEIVP